MTNRAAFWDKAAEKYAKSPISDVSAYEYTLDRTRSYLGAGDRMLELGCGTGTTALRFAPFVAHITATDLSDGMIRIAKRKAATDNITNVQFEVRDILSEIGDDSFDVVTGFNLFHLVPDMERNFREIAALLPQGGYFISKTACLAQRGGGIKGLMVRGVLRAIIPVMQAIGKAPYVRSFDIAELEAAINAAGFEIVESGNHPAGPPVARYVVARKL